MAEYLREDGQTLIIPYPGTETTQSIVYSVYDTGIDQYIQYDELTARGTSGAYEMLLSTDVTKYDRSLRIDIQVIEPSNYFEDTVFVDIVRPLSTPDDIITHFQPYPDLGPIVLNLSQDYLYALERKARFLICSYTNQDFKFEYKTVGAYGMNTDLLHLGQRIESFDKITYDDYLIYDSTEDPIIDELGANIAIAPSKHAIKVVAEGANISEWVDQNPLNNPAYFGKDSAYLVRGEYGWRFIPQDIKDCVHELVGDYLCNDFIYRNKGLKSIQNDSFNIQFADGMLNGTGNLYVDTILAKYKSWNLKAI